MAIVVTFLGSAQGGLGTALSITISEDVAVGERIIVTYGNQGGGTSGYGCGDVGGNSYVQDAIFTETTPSRSYMTFSAECTTALSVGDAITVTSPNNYNRCALVCKATDIDHANHLDQSATFDDGQSTTPIAPAQTSTVDDALFIGQLATQNGTELETFEDPNYTRCGYRERSQIQLNQGYRVITAAETRNYAPTLTNSENWGCWLVLYRGNTGPPPAPAPFDPSLFHVAQKRATQFRM